MWPFYRFSFWTSRVVWLTGCTGFLRSCFNKLRVSLSPLLHSSFQIRKGPHLLTPLLVCNKFLLAMSTNPPRKASCSRTWGLHAASDFELLLTLLSGFPVDMSIPKILDAIGLVADGELVGTCAICNSFFFLLFLHPLRHSFGAAYQAGILSAANRAEMADVEQLKKSDPLVACLRVDVWCRMYWLWILESRFILSNNQSKATQWVLDTCLIVGLRPFNINSITASLSSKTYNIALEPECVPLDETWSTLVRSRLVCVVGICFRMFGWVFADRFPRGSLTSLVLLVWFGEEWNTSITESSILTCV